MPFSKEFKYNQEPDFDYIISEGGSNFVAVRKIKFGVGQDEECNPEDRKIDIRKWSIDAEGNERALKGVNLNDEAVDELVSTLVKLGYGDTSEIINGIKDREEFMDLIIPFTIENIDLGDLKEELHNKNKKKYFDPKEVLGS